MGDPQDCLAAYRAALDQAGIGPESLAVVVSAADGLGGLDRVESGALAQLGLAGSTRILTPKRNTGETQSAAPLIGVDVQVRVDRLRAMRVRAQVAQLGTGRGRLRAGSPRRGDAQGGGPGGIRSGSRRTDAAGCPDQPRPARRALPIADRGGGGRVGGDAGSRGARGAVHLGIRGS